MIQNCSGVHLAGRGLSEKAMSGTKETSLCKGEKKQDVLRTSQKMSKAGKLSVPGHVASPLQKSTVA